MENIKLNLEKPIVFYPQLSRALGGALEALYVQQLYYWSDKGKRKDGWIYKTKIDIEKETTITIRQQDRVRKNLESKGILETKLMKANGSPTLHYKLNIGILQKVILEYDEMSYSNHTKGKIPLTENTTEITTENTTTPLQAMENKEITEIINAFKDVNPSYRKYFGNKTNEEKFAPTIMTPCQLEDKLGNLLLFVDKKQRSATNNVF